MAPELALRLGPCAGAAPPRHGALRRCANVRCTNLSGPSEAALRVKLCTGCRTVRYCSEACSQADWQAHRLACRLLRRQREAGAATGGQTNE